MCKEHISKIRNDIVAAAINDKTNKSKTVDTRPNSIEKTGYSTATEMMFYSLCNQFDLDVTLKAGEKKEVI